MSDILSNILAKRVTCPACDEDNPLQATTCTACGTALGTEDEESVSYISEEQRPVAVDTSSLTPEQAALVEKMRTKIPLERSQNFRMLKDAAQGALDGTVTPEQYRTAVRKLRNIGESGVKVLANKTVQQKVAALSEEAQRASAAMAQGFQQIFDGAVRMERWPASGDLNDVTEGARLAEAGYRGLDAAQDAALLLS